MSLTHVHDLADHVIAAHGAEPPIVFLNGIAQGSGYDQRRGRGISMKSMQLRWHLDHNDEDASQTDVGTTPEPCTIGVFVIMDTRPGAAVPAYQDIFTKTEAPGVHGFHPDDFLNPDNSDRFSIVYRQVVTKVWTGTEAFPLSRDEFVQTMNWDTRYDDTGATLADCGTPALYLVVVKHNHAHNNTTVAANNTIGIRYSWRLTYRDLL